MDPNPTHKNPPLSGAAIVTLAGRDGKHTK